MLMWKPSENSAAYAYHNELATDIQEDEEYGLPQDSLVVPFPLRRSCVGIGR